MDSIISISYVNQIIDVNCNSPELIKFLKKSKIIIRPSDYEGLMEFINSMFKPKKKQNQSLCITGILPSGERTEIKDNETYSKNISIFLVSYKKETHSTLFGDFKPELYFRHESLEIPELPKSEQQLPNLKETTRRLSMKFKEDHRKIYNNFIGNFNDKLNEYLNYSMKDIVLGATKENIKKIDTLRKSFIKKNSELLEKKDSCKQIIKIINKNINEIQETVENTNANVNENVNEDVNENQNKYIFEFSEKKINIEKEIKDKKIKIENIKIKNISDSEYQSSLMSFLKEENSDKNINFDQNEISNEFPFEDGDTYKSKQEKDQNLKLIIDGAKEDSTYRMFISIINKNNKKIISESPLEVVFKIKKSEKILSQEKITNILNNLKNEIKKFNLFLQDNDVIKIIQENKGDESKIKDIVKEKYNDNKKNKVNEIYDKLEKEMNFSKYLKRNDVEEQIINLELDENEIKKYIKMHEPQPNPEPQPDPEPQPGPEPYDKEKMEKILQDIEDDFYISSQFSDEQYKELEKEIIAKNYDYEKIKEYVEEQM